MSRQNNPATDEAVAASLYTKHEKIYPREVHGIFASLRWLAVTLLLGLYYVTAWINWDGQQLLLFDLPARKFHIFWWTFWPQDFFYLVVILIIAALALFFFTALAGRLWCGYACPQTVWTEIFMWIEHKIEGDRPQQQKLDQSPWDGHKLRVKASKHLLWLLLSLWTGFTFVGYFTPIRELADAVLSLSTGPWETFWMLFYAFATWGNAGFMREQVCIYMCPYARFQSAMIDADTMVVSYDVNRGEPRGSRRRSEDPATKGLGDCIDCRICVQACPTGIDIRDGQQYQCISCAACIDACDDVMDKMGYAKGLVRHTTFNMLTTGKSKILRPRIFLYAVFLLLLSGGLLTAVANRVPLELDVIRDRNKLYHQTYDGMIENVYTLRLINKDRTDHRLKISVTGIDGISMIADKNVIPVAGGEVTTLAVRLRADPFALASHSAPINFHVHTLDDDSLHITKNAKFIGPFER